MSNGELHPRPRGHVAAVTTVVGLIIIALAISVSGCRVLGYPMSAGAANSTPTLTVVLAEAEVTSTVAQTLTPEPTLTWTPTSTPSNTPIPPTNTPVPPTATVQVLTDTPVPPTDTVAPTDTVVPTDTPGVSSPTPPCAETPQWGLGDVWQNPEVKDRLGCPVGPQVGVQGEEIYFQHGHMLWRSDNGLIYILFAPYMRDGWGAYPDMSVDAAPLVSVPMPPTPRVGEPRPYFPEGRFGYVWLANPWMEERLGWAVSFPGQELGELINSFSGAVQDFQHGVLFWNHNVCFVLYTDDMSWTIY